MANQNTKRLARQMKKAIKAWETLDQARRDFEAAWKDCDEESRAKAFQEVGIAPALEALTGSGHDAFQDFGC